MVKFRDVGMNVSDRVMAMRMSMRILGALMLMQMMVFVPMQVFMLSFFMCVRMAMPSGQKQR